MRILYIIYSIIGLVFSYFLYLYNYNVEYQHNHSSIISCHYPDSDIGIKIMDFKYPLFRNAKYEKIILHPGDILHIPKNFSHWCFSIGDPDNYNLNISINYWDKDELNNFGNKIKGLRIDKNYLELWSKIIIEKLISDNISNYPVIISKNKEITPVDKEDNTLRLEYLSLPEIFNYRNNLDLENKGLDNKIALAQNPDIINKLDGFKPDIYPINQKGIFNNINFWMNFGDVNTGLHYDEYVGFLLQMVGIKIVYLFSPDEKSHLYFNKKFKFLS